MAQLSPLLYSHTPSRPFPDPLIIIFYEFARPATRRREGKTSSLRWYLSLASRWKSFHLGISRATDRDVFAVSEDAASNSAPAPCLTGPLKTSVSLCVLHSSFSMTISPWLGGARRHRRTPIGRMRVFMGLKTSVGSSPFNGERRSCRLPPNAFALWRHSSGITKAARKNHARSSMKRGCARSRDSPFPLTRYTFLFNG